MPPGDSPSSQEACPGAAQLAVLHGGNPSPQTLDEIDAHLSTCPSCRVVVYHTAEADQSLVSTLRGSPAEDAYACEPEYSQLVARVRAIRVGAYPPAADCTLLPAGAPLPARVGEYQLLEELGQGGMGQVYRARHTHLKRVVAVKVLDLRRFRDAAALARFRREMRATADLDHPNIVRATDAGEADGLHYLVMEHVEGMDLSRLLRAAGRVGVADACELARQTALALEYIKARGLVHRDIKPSNLMLTPAGRLKVLDLGLARLREDECAAEALTESAHVLGTVDYMAPEQASNPRAVDFRADLYALGCTLYHLLTGRAPFVGREYRSRYEKQRAHARAAPVLIRSLRPEVPRPVAAIVHRLLAKDPAQRYASPAALAEALAPHASCCDLPRLLTAAREKAEARLRDGTPVTNGFAPEQPDEDCQCAPGGPGAADPLIRTSSARRRRMLFALGAPGLIFLCVGFATLAALGPTRGTTAAPPQQQNSDRAAPRVWHPVLDRLPTELIWDKSSGESHWNLTGPQELWVTCHDDRGLLGVGTAHKAGYQIQVDVGQEGWSGGIGVFFGHGEGAHDGAPCRRYQFVELLPYLAGDPARAFTLCRGVDYLIPMAGAGHPRSVRRQLASEILRRPDPHAQMLELTVTARGLVGVRWGGQELPALKAPSVNAQFGEADYVGDFGTLNCTSAGVFRNFRALFYERND